MTRIRQRLPEEVYGAVFALILAGLKSAKLVKGKKLGIDASVIDANASMRTLEHRLKGEVYHEAAYANLALLMRTLCGIGTPKQALAAAAGLFIIFLELLRRLYRPRALTEALYLDFGAIPGNF